MTITDRNKIVGNEVRAAREAASVSQTTLAAEMRSRGWKWSQVTVYSIEMGDRPLRWLEAKDLHELIGFATALGGTDAAELAKLRTLRNRLLEAVEASFEQ